MPKRVTDRLAFTWTFLALLLFGGYAAGQTSTWSLNPVDANYGNPANWSAGVPNSPNAIAQFGDSATKQIIHQAQTTVVSALEFNAGGPGYFIINNGGTVNGSTFDSFLTLTGAGIVNNDQNHQQAFNNDFNAGEGNTFGSMIFENQSTSGNSIFINRDNVNPTILPVGLVILRDLERYNLIYRNSASAGTCSS
jgi:hypothetical protein